jgi:integrase
MRDHKRAVNTLREKIEAGERGGSDDDQAALIAFSDEMKLMRETYSWARHEKLLRHCTRIGEEVGGLADALEDKTAAESIVNWIHDTYDLDETPETNQSYRVALKVFGRRVANEGGDPPDSIGWIKSTLPRSYDPTPDRADMIEWEEAKQLIDEGAKNPRDEALIAVAHDLGARPGELYGIRRGDILDTDYGMQILVDGKRGEHQPTIIRSVPYLQKWLGDSRCPTGPKEPLWGNLDGSGQVSYNRFLDIFKDAAGRIGFEKPVTAANFRKSNAYHLSQIGASATHIEDRQGRKRASKHVARYVARFGPENEEAQYARLHGIDVEQDEPDSHAPVECPRCNRDTPHDEAFCMWCHQALAPGAVDEIEADQSEVRPTLLRFAKENPQLIDRVEEMEPVIEMFGGDPELINAAQDFTDALEAGED